MGFIRASVFCGKLFHNRLALHHVIKINLTIPKGQISDGTIIENFALTSFSQDQKFMGVITTNWATVCPHWNSLQTHAFVCAQIAHQVAVIGVQRVLFGEVKVIAIFHVKLTPTHHPKAWTAFIAKFPLYLIHGQRQIFVACHVATKDVSN